MHDALAYALAALVLFGFADVIYKRGVAAGVLPHRLLMVQSWVFLPSVALYGLATGTLTFVTGTLWGAAVGLFVWLGFYNFAHSLKSGAVSINAPVFRLSFVLTAVLAMLLLGEPVTIPKLAGIVLAAIAVWLLLAAPGANAVVAPRETRASLLRVIIATVAVGIGNFLYKYGLRDGATPASLIFTQAVVVVTLSTCLAGAIDRRIRPSGAVLLVAPLAAIVLALAFACMVESLARGEASRMVPIAQMGLAVTAVLGFLFLGERFTWRKGIGLLAALAALAGFAHG